MQLNIDCSLKAGILGEGRCGRPRTVFIKQAYTGLAEQAHIDVK